MTTLKGAVHTKITVQSSSTHPHVIPNPYDILPSVEHKIRYLANCPRYSFPYNEIVKR